MPAQTDLVCILDPGVYVLWLFTHTWKASHRLLRGMAGQNNPSRVPKGLLHLQNASLSGLLHLWGVRQGWPWMAFVWEEQRLGLLQPWAISGNDTLKLQPDPPSLKTQASLYLILNFPGGKNILFLTLTLRGTRASSFLTVVCSLQVHPACNGALL